jgi:hypothetical protein
VFGREKASRRDYCPAMIVAALAIVLAALDMEGLFPGEDMFDSRRAWRSAGFAVVARDEPTRIMVAGHMLAPSLIFKKYANLVPAEKQLEKYKIRVDGANAVAGFIAAHQIKGVVVPEKQIIQLGNARGSLVVAQRLDVMDDDRSEAAYPRITDQTLHDLVTVLYTFRGLDSGLRNLPLTRTGQVALIDTERWNDPKPRAYLKSIRRYLTRKQMAFVNETLKELHGKARSGPEPDDAGDS